MNDRMGERQILAGKLLLVAHQILRTPLVAVDRPFVGAAGKACESDVHVVGRAAHQADRVFGDGLEAAMAALKVFPRPRDHVADIDRLAGLGIGHQADIGVPMLKVEDLGQRPGGARKGRVVDDRGNLVAADPKVAPARQTTQKLFAGTRRHAASCDACW